MVNPFNLFKNSMPMEDYGDYDEYWQKRSGEKAERGKQYAPLLRAQQISRFIPKGSAILDVGFGDATLMDYLREHNAPARLAGLEISHRALDGARARGHEVYEVDISTPALAAFLESNDFDCICLCEIIEHIKEAEKLVRLLKAKKRVIVSIPNTGYIIYRLRLLFGHFPGVMVRYHIKEHIRFWTMADFRFWSRALGFRLVAAVPYNCYLPGRIYPSLFSRQLIYVLEPIGKQTVGRL